DVRTHEALPAWLQSSKIESTLPYTSCALPRSGMRRNNKRELAHEVVTEWKLVYQVDRLCCSVGDPSSIYLCYVAVGDQFAQLLEEKPVL
nr:hypothetical protein [Tanacetum cinerariifolium]